MRRLKPASQGNQPSFPLNLQTILHSEDQQSRPPSLIHTVRPSVIIDDYSESGAPSSTSQLLSGRSKNSRPNLRPQSRLYEQAPLNCPARPPRPQMTSLEVANRYPQLNKLSHFLSTSTRSLASSESGTVLRRRDAQSEGPLSGPQTVEEGSSVERSDSAFLLEATDYNNLMAPHTGRETRQSNASTVEVMRIEDGTDRSGSDGSSFSDLELSDSPDGLPPPDFMKYLPLQNISTPLAFAFAHIDSLMALRNRILHLYFEGSLNDDPDRSYTSEPLPSQPSEEELLARIWQDAQVKALLLKFKLSMVEADVRKAQIIENQNRIIRAATEKAFAEGEALMPPTEMTMSNQDLVSNDHLFVNSEHPAREPKAPSSSSALNSMGCGRMISPVPPSATSSPRNELFTSNLPTKREVEDDLDNAESVSSADKPSGPLRLIKMDRIQEIQVEDQAQPGNEDSQPVPESFDSCSESSAPTFGDFALIPNSHLRKISQGLASSKVLLLEESEKAPQHFKFDLEAIQRIEQAHASELADQQNVNWSRTGHPPTCPGPKRGLSPQHKGIRQQAHSRIDSETFGSCLEDGPLRAYGGYGRSEKSFETALSKA